MNPFTSRPSDSVAALGETKLIGAIRRWLGPANPAAPFGIGDDCAVLAPSRHRQLVTVDPVIYGRHFDNTAAPRVVGAKLLKRNLSDIAAMGGRPRAAVVALTLDRRTKRAWIEQFYRGLAVAARTYDVAIVGGDVAQADDVLAASLTLIGEATAKRVLLRSGARIGDSIWVTGELGNTFASGHHHAFEPRLAEGTWLAARNDVRAMMDISDGLAKDLHALTPPGAAPALEAASIPFRHGADLRSALSDGEDYELAFVLDRRADVAPFARAWARRFPRVRLTCIGRFVSARERPAGAINLEEFRGYEHLR